MGLAGFQFGPLSEGLVRAYMLRLQRDMGLQEQQRSREADYQDYVRRLQFQRQLEESDPRYRAEQTERQAEMRRIAAERRVQSILGLPGIGGDPNKALASFGQSFLDDWNASGGATLPTRTVPGTPGTPAGLPRTDVTVVPKTAPTPYERYRAGERGEPFVPKVFTKEIPGTPAIPATPERTELAIPGAPQPIFKTIGDVAAATGNTLIDPRLANRPLDSLPERFDINSLFRPPSAPPKRVVIMDQTGRVINVIEAPAGTEIRSVTTPQGQIIVPINPVTGQPQGQPYQLPPGARVVVTQQARRGVAGGTAGGGGGVPAGAPSGDRAAILPSGPRGGQYVWIPEYGRVGASEVGNKLALLAKSDPALAARRAWELGPRYATMAARFERMAKPTGPSSRLSKLRAERNAITNNGAIDPAVMSAADRLRIVKIDQEIAEIVRSTPQLPTPMTRTEALRRGAARQRYQPVPPRGQSPTPAQGKVYKTAGSGTLTTVQVRQIISSLKAQGATAAQIRAALLSNQIPPNDFGY